MHPYKKREKHEKTEFKTKNPNPGVSEIVSFWLKMDQISTMLAILMKIPSDYVAKIVDICSILSQ